MEGKFVILLVITALCVEQCLTSSIPMFEFLSRDEKVSKLNFYLTFNFINAESLKLRKINSSKNIYELQRNVCKIWCNSLIKN